jgi:hypothetical protein
MGAKKIFMDDIRELSFSGLQVKRTFYNGLQVKNSFPPSLSRELRQHCIRRRHGLRPLVVPRPALSLLLALSCARWAALEVSSYSARPPATAVRRAGDGPLNRRGSRPPRRPRPPRRRQPPGASLLVGIGDEASHQRQVSSHVF